jgi:hypothetical protein
MNWFDAISLVTLNGIALPEKGEVSKWHHLTLTSKSETDNGRVDPERKSTTVAWTVASQIREDAPARCPERDANRLCIACRLRQDNDNALSALDDLYLADLVESCLNILRSAAQGFLAAYGRPFTQRFKEKYPEIPPAHAELVSNFLKGPAVKVLAGLIGMWWAGSTGWLSAIWDLIARLKL